MVATTMPPLTRTLTAVYMRVSSEEQRERQSIETQRDYAGRYTAREGGAVRDYYADDGISGTIALDQRPEGQRLLNDARAGKVRRLLIYKLDRLGREALVILSALDELAKCGVEIVSMTEALDLVTPHGRFMAVIQAGAAGYERDSIVQRSMAGSERLARQGVWLGGIVPFGYRVVGKDRDARLVVSEEQLPGLRMSEADVIRLIYRLITEERWSCVKIAHHLTALGVPTAYTRDGREPLRGKRTAATSGIWRPSRVRNLIVGTVYKGIHTYGKRSKRAREVIEREVPAIVGVETWERAQQVLRENMTMSTRNAKRRYLLRGLMKCDLCGLTYIGTAYKNGGTKNSKFNIYYVCNGKHQARGIYGEQATRCPSAYVRGDEAEASIWADVEHYLRNPGDPIRQLHERLAELQGQGERLRDEAAALRHALDQLKRERDAVVGLFRKGRIDDADLDRQLDQIQGEEGALRQQLERLTERARGMEAATEELHGVESTLRELNRRLDGSLTWELRRELIETLVGEMRIVTVEAGGKREPEVHVRYRFASTTTRMRAPAAMPATRSRNAPVRRARSRAMPSVSPARCSTGSISTWTCPALRMRSSPMTVSAKDRPWCARGWRGRGRCRRRVSPARRSSPTPRWDRPKCASGARSTRRGRG